MIPALPTARPPQKAIRPYASLVVWTLQASIFPENVASVRLHERAGFRVIGTRERIGRFHDGRWRDTVLMERRSEEVGRG